MTKVAVTGAKGFVGSKLVEKYGCTPIFSDITDSASLHHEIYRENPDVLIHCAALTDVDYCEKHFKDAFEVNVRGTSNAASAMSEGSLFIYLSTDHLFSGDDWFNMGYSERHKPSPVNYYGFTKWGGEIAAQTEKCRTIVVRGSKCIDYSWAKPTLDKLKQGDGIIMTDLIKRSFVHVNDFISGIFTLINMHGSIDESVINIAGMDVFSYYQFWHIIKEKMGLTGEIIPRREKLPNASPRPFRAGLDCHLAKKNHIPIYSIVSAIELLEKGI